MADNAYSITIHSICQCHTSHLHAMALTLRQQRPYNIFILLLTHRYQQVEVLGADIPAIQPEQPGHVVEEEGGVVTEETHGTWRVQRLTQRQGGE